MQPRTLQQINSELGSVYDPQVENIRQQQAALPGQIEAEEKGLGAKQEQAFGDIIGGARRRGLGFSGIPIGEQYKYNATEYMPALARLRQSGNEQKLSLEQAILGINERRNQNAQSNYQYETTLAEQRRQFDEQQAMQRAEAARQQALARSAGGFSPTLGGKAPVNENPLLVKNLSGGKSLGEAVQALQGLLGSGNPGVIRNTITAIQNSAKRGNTYDQAKLQIINSRPEFRQYMGTPAVKNGGGGW